METDQFDTVVVGGGFFGCCIALALAGRHRTVAVLEGESTLLTHASYVNQARVHNGYHYPRSFITALRSAVNYPQFLSDFEDCLDRTFQQVYAVARNGSRVNAYQFEKFCRRVGIPISRTPPSISKLFNPALVEEAFCTEECAFDAVRLRQKMAAAMAELEVTTIFRFHVSHVSASRSGLLIHESDGRTIHAGQVFSCTYANTNRLLGRSALPLLPLKFETAEMAYIEVPEELKSLGITVMDGPFFSTMPFPPLGLHSLSHVTYTPHQARSGFDQSEAGSTLSQIQPRAIYMLRDAQRYVPALGRAQYQRSLLATKTVLLSNEIDDGRPILCRRNCGLPNLHVVVGAKIDNVYDVLKTLGVENALRRSSYESGIRDGSERIAAGTQ